MRLKSNIPNRSLTVKFTSTLCFIISSMMLILGCGLFDDTDVSNSGTVVIATDDGDVQCVNGASMISCKGIPYAEPPVGDLRFAPPQEITTARTAPLDATEYGNSCPQNENTVSEASATEDCLFLNVFMPKDGTGPYPVMVWIHGGAFISGASGTASNDPYNPAALVAQGVVVVTINYRLGILGFLPLAALTSEAGQSGNYGLMDQHMALEWIQDHIDDFDGDPGNVTIFGESAGGHSILSHLAAPSSFSPRYLFHKAIVQSGAFDPGQWDLTEGYTNYGDPFATSVGCTTGTTGDIVACLRGLTVAQILEAQDGISVWPSPVIGGSGAFLETSIAAVFAADGIPGDVPVLIGCNKDEGQLFTLMEMGAGQLYATRSAYDAAVAANLSIIDPGFDAAAIAAYYVNKHGDYASSDPVDITDSRYRDALSEFRTDYMFVYNTKVIWDQISDATDTYAYWFTDDEAPVLDSSWNTGIFSIDATHGLEIQYVFGTLGERDATEDQITLSDTMIGYWTNFAKTGVPDDAWEPYRVGDEFVLKLDDPTPTVTDVDDAGGFCDTHDCAYWASPPLSP